MRNMIFLPVFSMLILLGSCAGVGIVATSNPMTKLNDAQYLFTVKDRPGPAEKLILEAREICQKQNDLQCLAHSHTVYGEFLLSSPVVKGEKLYRQYGFQDKSVTFENRIAKSKEHFTKALGYYQTAEKQFREAESFDKLTNLYFNMGVIYFRLDDLNTTCKFYDKSLAAYIENIRRNPTAQPQFSSRFKSLADQLLFEKKRVGCE